jgi:hypothetical protein
MDILRNRLAAAKTISRLAHVPRTWARADDGTSQGIDGRLIGRAIGVDVEKEKASESRRRDWKGRIPWSKKMNRGGATAQS